MGINEEETLTTTLIDPESLDNPNPTYQKGELQESKCRDAWAAILFYAQLIAVCCVCGILGVPAVRRNVGDVVVVEGRTDYTGLIYVTLIAAASSFTLSTISLTLMTTCPKFLIQLSLLFSLLLSLLITATSFYYQQYIAGAFGILFFLLSCCYACCVWRRIPFAAANLNTGLTAVKRNGGVFVTSVWITVVSFGYLVVWMVAMVGVYDATAAAAAAAVDGNTNVQPSWGYLFLLLLALFWTQQVFQNTIHVIVAGVVSTWWFAPDEASSCCSVAIKDSFIRATTSSFGSICFGSLLVAIIQTLRSMVESARHDSSNDGCAAFMLCLVDCLLQCLQGILEYFNKFAYIYVGMYGYSYLEAGKNVMTLFRAKGWDIIIADDLVSNTLSLFALIGGGLVGCVGLATNAAFPSWLAGFEGAASGIAFGFSFLIGLVISSIMLSVVDSSVNTVLVSFAEAPEEFQQNHPKLSGEMRDAWRVVYPAECGF
mmetsp:Transcript_4365/g.6522  ORF Transcript_4365/g.6522 Transcript_4365/m.6522 type:complete len:485 (-) Transcript_4365:41-1495(-)